MLLGQALAALSAGYRHATGAPATQQGQGCKRARTTGPNWASTSSCITRLIRRRALLASSSAATMRLRERLDDAGSSSSASAHARAGVWRCQCTQASAGVVVWWTMPGCGTRHTDAQRPCGAVGEGAGLGNDITTTKSATVPMVPT
jgi:hypothetical protein